MKKTLICILLLVLFTGACLSGKAESNTWPVEITDHAGRQVVIESEPETIVSGYYIATSMLIGLGQADKLIGIENDAQLRPVYALSAPELLDLPGVGTVKLLDLEMCAALQPDLMILPLRLADMAPNLEALGIEVLFVNPESRTLQEEALSMIAAATGSSERGAAMLDFIHDKLDGLENALAGVERPLAYFSGNSAYLKTAGPMMYQHVLLESAGCENAAQAINDTYWAEISYEQLLAWNPDCIIMAADAKYTADDLAADPVLADLRAVAEGRIYAIPGHIESWDSPVPGSFLGGLYLASALHPEAYPHEAYASAAAEFYETFYGFTPVI